MKKRLVLPIFLLLTAVTACSSGQQAPPPAEPDLVGVLKSRPSLQRFTEALESTGVASSLLSSGTYTVFAPMDKAVNEPLDAATVRHHILLTRVTFSDMAGESTSFETLNDDEIEIDATEQIAIGSGLMVESDIRATNGVIHVIDRVQIPVDENESLIDQDEIADPETDSTQQ
ncbi:MAG: fasciclin domain-containing protein [Geminicoccaceae bacterium]